MSISDAIYAAVPPWAQTVLLNAYAARIRQHRYGRRYRQWVSELERRETWSASQVRAYQDGRVRDIVAIAYEETEHYRAVMDAAGLTPADIRGVEDLEHLPILDKETVRHQGQRLRTSSEPRRGWLKGHTSGTTGSPLDIWYDRDTCALNNAVDERQKRWGGMRSDDWVGLLLGRVVVPPRVDRPPFWRRNHVLKQTWYSSFHLTDRNLPLYVEHMRRSGLRFLEGYPSTMYVLARHVLSAGGTLPMRAVFTSSETLHAVQRETIEQAFDCAVFDFYGHAERTVFATECEAHDGKHICEEYGFVEVVDAEGKPVPLGEPGFLVGTSLHNVATPMLRYNTGDVTSILNEPCPCGRASRRLANVTTKAEDIVVTPDGRLISPSVLTHPFKPFHQIIKSQLVQPDRSNLRVRIVRSDDFGDAHERELIEGLQARLGPEMNIRVEYVEEIPSERSGKFRWVISSVPHEYSVSWEDQPPANV